MTTYTPILQIAQVATNQSQKETTINTGFAVMEGSANDFFVVDLSAGSAVLTIDQYTKYIMFRGQGHTVSRNLDTPTLSGTFTGKRFFIVSNEGTGSIVVRPSGSGTGTITVGSGNIVLIQNDGSALRAISSGVALLTDLSDVDASGFPPANNSILKYNSGTSKWDAGTFSNITDFTDLADVPANYTSAGLKMVRVNSGATALEFVETPCDLQFFFQGVPGSLVNRNYIVLRNMTLVASLTGSQYFTGTNPTATTVFAITKIHAGTPSSIGSISFNTSGVGTPTFASPVTFVAGDIIKITTPTVADVTAADITIGLKGSIT